MPTKDHSFAGFDGASGPPPRTLGVNAIPNTFAIDADGCCRMSTSGTEVSEAS